MKPLLKNKSTTHRKQQNSPKQQHQNKRAGRSGAPCHSGIMASSTEDKEPQYRESRSCPGGHYHSYPGDNRQTMTRTKQVPALSWEPKSTENKARASCILSSQMIEGVHQCISSVSTRKRSRATLTSHLFSLTTPLQGYRVQSSHLPTERYQCSSEVQLSQGADRFLLHAEMALKR